MKRRKKCFAPDRAERLEDRLTLTHLGALPPAPIGHPHPALVDYHRPTRAGHHHSARSRHPRAGLVTPVTGYDATGTMSGRTAGDPGPIAGTVRLSGKVEGSSLLDGSGAISAMGSVTSAGALTATGAEPVVYAGTITLSAATGSVTASLSGRLFGPNRLGETIDLTYTITGGTGAFAGASGSGHASFTRGGPGPGGGFTLTFGDTTTPS